MPIVILVRTHLYSPVVYFRTFIVKEFLIFNLCIIRSIMTVICVLSPWYWYDHSGLSVDGSTGKSWDEYSMTRSISVAAKFPQ